MSSLMKDYGIYTFTKEIMRERIPNSTYRAFKETTLNGEPLSKETATVIANAMKIWAIEKGATHFTHWFTPMTGLSAEKHDSFLELENDKPLIEFSGKTLRKGESDASSFPSGGLRATFEARGYTAWDTTSDAFVKGGTLYIPTIFCSYSGEALDKKTPLLRSCDALSKATVRLMHNIGYNDIKAAKSYVGAEQEYFLVADEYFQKRLDLKLCNRTLFGKAAPKGQEMEDHYYGSIKRKVAAFMKELDEECWKYAIPSKTKHNEAAPAQHEVACIYREVNITCDNNHLLMQLMNDIAKKHGLRCILHEKPFSSVNGSGKHNNWSVVTDTGINLFKPSFDSDNNLPFLVTLSCLVKGIDEFADLLRITSAGAGNDYRLGANEAPPAIISMFLGDELNALIDATINQTAVSHMDKTRFKAGVNVVADFSKDTSDRNRTSPFAFTGNKFEFRMVGSSQSIAGPNTMLNAILAHEMNEMSALIESGQDVKDVMAKFLNEHRRIIFDGDGYSKEWEIEASIRGLANRKDSIAAYEHFLDEGNVKMLTGLGIYTKDEMSSRYDIMLENYAKTINIEARVAKEMALNQIYPVALDYLKNISKTYKALIDIELENEVLKTDLVKYNQLVSTLRIKIDELDSAINKYTTCKESMIVKAKIARNEMLKAINDLREVVDEIEDQTDNKIWPMPSYIDLMFGI